jgi:hypothetical protein
MVKLRRASNFITRTNSAPVIATEKTEKDQHRVFRNYLKSISLGSNDYVKDDDDFSEANFHPWCCQQEIANVSDKTDTDCESVLMGPPRIKRNSRIDNEGVQDNCSFPESFIFWENSTSISKNALLEYVKEDTDDSQLIFQSLSEMETWGPEEHDGDDSEESTVVISNIGKQPPVKMVHQNVSSDIRIGGGNHESLLDVFQIKLTAPLDFPKEKRWSKLNEFITRSPSGRQISVNAAARDIPEKYGKHDYWFQCATFHQLYEFLLLGVSLKNMDVPKKLRSPPRIGTLLKKSNEFLKKTRTISPAKKLDSILSKKQSHRRTSSDSMQRIKTILSRKATSCKFKLSVKNEWSKMDDAVSGRLDGLDIIAMGSVRKVSYIGEKEKSLSGQRYTLRCMILDSLWSASARDPSDIVFEGFSQRGEGKDRWTTKIEDWKLTYDVQTQNHLWGKDNDPPPPLESKLNEVQTSPKSIAAEVKCNDENVYVIRTLEQLQAAHEHAVVPLKVNFSSTLSRWKSFNRRYPIV